MNPRYPSRQQQEGVVLLVSLLLMLVITLIGYSVMETSALEARMAAAKEAREFSFQASESVIEDVVDNVALVNSARAADLSGAADPNQAYVFSHDSDLSSSAVVSYTGDALAYGEDWNKGLKNQFFELRVKTTRAGNNFDSIHIQGFKKKAPTL